MRLIDITGSLEYHKFNCVFVLWRSSETDWYRKDIVAAPCCSPETAGELSDLLQLE